MKKFLTLTFAMILAFVLVACGGGATPESVKIEASSKSVKVGRTIQLKASVKPEKAAQDVVWASDKQNIATVDATGKVTGVSAGRAVITATCADAPSVSSKITINVSNSNEVDFGGYTIRIAYSPGVEHELDPRITDVPAEYTISPTRKYAAEAWRAVEDKYNCHIEVAGYPTTDYWARFDYILEQGKNNTTEFDIYWIPTNQISKTSSALITFDKLYASYGNNSMSEADVLARTYKGSLYGWSYTSGNITSDDPVIGVNYNLLKKIHMDGDKEPAKLFMEDKWHINEFVEWCLEAQTKLNGLSTGEDDKYYVISGRLSYWLRDLSRTSGVALADTITRKIRITDPKVVNLANMLKELFDAGCVDPANQVDGKVETWNNEHALLNTGSAYFVDYYNRWKADLWGAGDDTLYGFVPWPYGADQTYETARWATYTQDCFVIPKAITEKIKNALETSEDVTVENIFKVWYECYQKTQELMEADPQYDKEATDRIVASGKWDTEASVDAWLYIQNNLKTKGIFDPIKELRLNNGDGEEWEKFSAGYIIPSLKYTEETDYVAAVTPAIANLEQTFVEKYN
ncbi:MAG: Ig-like domain-containing protein [Bacilli bacterium]|nr:Ig-like domain-containing protein [Bacilli bacterium]